ncbi:MAG: hypothetical protein AB1576_05005 [Bacillota bacterium]|jgi:hypothetical protein
MAEHVFDRPEPSLTVPLGGLGIGYQIEPVQANPSLKDLDFYALPRFSCAPRLFLDKG